jgi:hypothetical protein
MVDATDLKSVVRKGVRVRVPPSAPLALGALSNHIIVHARPAPHCCSVARGLPSVAQRLGNVDAANILGIGQVGDGAGNTQYACVAARR